MIAPGRFLLVFPVNRTHRQPRSVCTWRHPSQDAANQPDQGPSLRPPDALHVEFVLDYSLTQSCCAIHTIQTALQSHRFLPSNKIFRHQPRVILAL
jgi:hypothetical protein